MRFRLAKPADLEICRSLIHPGVRMRAPLRGAIVDIWRALLDDDVLSLCVVEDPALPYPRCIEFFAAGVFVAEDFAHRFMARPDPALTARIYDEILANRSPVLSLREIARGNAGAGLSSVTLHFELRGRDFTSPRMSAVLTAAAESGRFFRTGYRLNAFMGVVHGGQLARYLRAGGLPVLDFPDAAAGDAPADLAEEERPYLVLQRKDQVPPSAVHGHMPFYHAPPPVLGLSRAEQRVLERALLEEPDPAIAAALDVSLDAVKKTWRSAFARVGRAMPHLLPSQEGGRYTRGSEKRRHLLRHLRAHLEELRPYAPATRRQKPSSRAR